MKPQNARIRHEETSRTVLNRRVACWFACSLFVCPAQNWKRGLDNSSGMPALSSFKGVVLIGFVLVPHDKNHAHPDICQGPNDHAAAFPLPAFALVIGLGPRLLIRRLPGELVQGIAQGFHAGEAVMNSGIVAAFERHQRGSRQGGDAAGHRVALAVVSPFRQQPGCQTFAGSGLIS